MSGLVALNQLTGSNTASSIAPTTGAAHSYDAAGNLTQTLGSDGSKTLYSYDDADRLVRLERRDASGVPVSASEWVYDFASRKPVSREFSYANGAWTQTDEKRRVFDGMDVVQERNGLNQVTAQLVRSGNIGGILSRSTAMGASFFGYDGGGNVTLLTDANGNEVGHYRYDAFGNTLEASGTRATENPYRFSTKELSSSGLYDFGYRFYSPSTGTWLNRDPLRENGGVNLYGMVGNNPTNRVNPRGLCVVALAGAIVGGVAGGIGSALGDVVYQAIVNHGDLTKISGAEVVGVMVAGGTVGAITGGLVGGFIDGTDVIIGTVGSVTVTAGEVGVSSLVNPILIGAGGGVITGTVQNALTPTPTRPTGTPKPIRRARVRLFEETEGREHEILSMKTQMPMR